MKLAFSTLGCPGWDFAQILLRAKQYGFDAVELRGIGEIMRVDQLPVLFPENRTRTAAQLKECGVALCSLDCSASFHDPANKENALREALFAIEAAAALEVPFIRVFGDRLRPDEAESVTIRRVSDGIRTLCQAAAGTGVSVLLETHGQFNTAERLLTVAEQVDRPEFGLLWDIEHTEAQYGSKRLDFYEKVEPLVRHVHMKDCLLHSDGKLQLCLPGQGILPLREIADALTARHYDGLFSLEWEKRWNPTLPEPEEAFPAFCACMRG